MAGRRRNSRPQVLFTHKLVRHQWLLPRFGVERFEPRVMPKAL